VIVLLAGCGSTDQVSDDMAGSEDAEFATPASPPPGQVEFVSRTDTVDALNTDTPAATDSPTATGTEQFAIQIGAFRDPQNAVRFQKLTRERYHLSMSNEFNPGLGLYQIRIGSFPREEEARVLLIRMQAEYPLEYKDAWIVQVSR
jgi:cell division septation protein DedD